MEEIGELLGWIIVISFSATLLNYILKFVNRNYKKVIQSSPELKKLNTLAMKVFVRHHKFWGIVSIVALLVHFYVQFTTYGVSTTGVLAGSLMLLQLLLGLYGAYIVLKRKGAWFVTHRMVSIALILGIFIHIL